MLQTEFLRSLNSNYERILLDKNPEEKRYQYCMISRGGIKGLLPCSLRYINGLGYLYYDITSKQNIAQIYGKRQMTRQWLKDFMWSMRQIREELSRFLLDEQNVLWYPQQIYQDLESNVFSFLYVPYYVGDNGFGKLLEFMVENIDYEDEKLVECVYRMYEQFEVGGQDYLQNRIFQDAEMLEETVEEIQQVKMEEISEEKTEEGLEDIENLSVNTVCAQEKGYQEKAQEKLQKKGIIGILKNKRNKDKEVRDNYRESMQLAMAGYAVAEETVYDEEEWGKTIYIEEPIENKEKIYGLYTPEGRLVARLKGESLTIGKRKEEVDVVMEDMSVSRMHARIFGEGKEIYLEDLNSTNGTYKNGLRLQPYEKRKLETEDEITIGKRELIFRQLTQ